MTTTSILYSDVDLNFIPNPHTGDLIRKTNMAAIERSVRQALQMNPFDVPFDSTMRSSVKGYLFDEDTSLSRAALKSDLEYLLKKIEPRINIKEIKVSSNNERELSITITYMNNSLNQIDTFTVVFDKVR